VFFWKIEHFLIFLSPGTAPVAPTKFRKFLVGAFFVQKFAGERAINILIFVKIEMKALEK